VGGWAIGNDLSRLDSLASIDNGLLIDARVLIGALILDQIVVVHAWIGVVVNVITPDDDP
jgi:hypothetical protein